MAVGDGTSPLASLKVTFGGFSPTLMDELGTTRAQVLKLQEESALRREMFKRQRELEFARTSKPVTSRDDSGSVWTYVVVDEKLVRIVDLESTATSITIPAELDGYPVYGIASDACAKNDIVEEVICGDSLEAIGPCAFRFCRNLKRIQFPGRLATYDPSWLSHCPSMEEIMLPGLLEVIDSSLFDNSELKRLCIGPAVREIVPGAFEKSRLEKIVIDERNPYIKTDGTMIYSFDESVALALARPVSEVRIPGKCKSIAKKALYGAESLKSVHLGEGLLSIGEFAFSHSGIRRFSAPSSLEEIQAKAFFDCGELREVTLNDGLRSIGSSAFERTGISKIRIPASIEQLGSSITMNTAVVHCGPKRTFIIDEASESLFTDGEGGLYRREPDGIHLIQLIDATLARYEVYGATKVIDDHAFAFNAVIEQVIVPEGVEKIEASAFRVCSKLRSVILADTVEEIGEEAFLDTALAEFRVPAGLVKLGRRALVTHGAHHGDQRPSLAKITVAPGNERFEVVNGILCEREGSALRAIVFTSSEPNVIFPDDLVRIEDYAFNNARGIEYLHINPALKAIGTCGLTTWCWIEHIHVEVAEPIEGRTAFDFHFPDTPKSIHGISMGIGGASWVNVPGLMAQFDSCVVNAHDYTSNGGYDSISVYDQARLVLGRLKDPVMLTEVNRGVYERLVRTHLHEICVDIARHDDRRAIDDMIDLGFLDSGNLESVIEQVGKLQDAAMTGYLLEVKRLRFGLSAMDFEL